MNTGAKERKKDPSRGDDSKRLRVSITVDRETWAEFQAELVRQGIATSEGPTKAIRAWLDENTLRIARALRRSEDRNPLGGHY